MKADAGKWGEWSLEGDDKKFRCTRNVGWGGNSEDGLKGGVVGLTVWTLLVFDIVGRIFS